MNNTALRILLLAVVLAALPAVSQGLRIEPPYLDGFHPLDEEPASTLSPLNARYPVLLKLESKMFHDTTQIDFEKRQITFRRTDPLGYTLWEYHYPELSDYLASRKRYAVARSWRKNMTMFQPSGIDASKKGMKLEWEWSVQYPSWAQRVLGKEPPKLTIDGYLEIKMGYANTQYDDDVPTQNYKANNDFNFEIDYQFTITGSVGRLINLNITASKNQNFDISNDLKNMKIEYKESTPGELEDEIVQEVIVGYTGFSMPGTNLSGYSESHEGLFGIKVRSRLGPLELTSIASIEQGQSNKKTYSSSGAGGGNTASFPADEYMRNKYFFLHNSYRRYYLHKYNIKNPDPNPVAPPRVATLSVWRSFDGLVTESQSRIKLVHVESNLDYYKFERLERDRHYYLDEVEGYIRFADSIYLQPQQQIAIYLRTEESTDSRYAGMQKGGTADTVNAQGEPDTTWTLWVLKPQEQIYNAEADPERFNLMWRNVYGPANFSDPTSFELNVKRISEDKTEEKLEQLPGGGGFYADIMGLSTENKPLINNQKVFSREFNELILPPYDSVWNEGEDGLEIFNNPDMGNRDSLIYRYSDEEIKNLKTEGTYKPQYVIEMSGSKKKTTYDDLGWGIMPGTEMVKADGVRLERDVDYTINYDMGSLDLISQQAKSAEKIEIEYQSEALFVPERKVFLGMHGRMELPFITDKSYAGASILFQSTSSNDDIPRLDQEPYSKALFDINTHIEFEPEWMTQLINYLPLVKTQTVSSVSLDLEFARSRVNPNKAKSAYVDDFEESKQSDQLSNSHQSWFVASPPYLGDSLFWAHPPVWDFYWFTPRDADKNHLVYRRDILVLSEAEQKASAVGTGTESVLRLHAVPAPKSDTLQDRFGKAWAGIMTPISQSFANKKQSQFFEFFIKADGGFAGKGTLLLQMGSMREDISLNGGPPNGRADREDTSQIVQKQNYVENLDLGWDKLPDSSEVYLIPGVLPGTWDTLGYGNPLLGADSTDPAKDNFRQYYYDKGDTANYPYACRREFDGKIEFSEDINFDGVVQTSNTERYFQFSVDLSDTASPFIDHSVNFVPGGGWRKYKIPLHELLPGYENAFDTINSPSWSNITMVRMIWTDFNPVELTQEQSLIFYNMEFVGNQWIEVADSSRVKIRSSVVNTKEDKEYEDIWEHYKNLINRERDEYGYEVEQSLRLNFVNLVPGDTALVERSFQYQTLNLSAYEKLSLVVFGKSEQANPDRRQPLYNENVRFVFRFGSDDSTYYEYTRPIYPEWNNIININLKEISDLKDKYMIAHRDGAIDTMKSISGGELRVHAPKERQPNFSRVQWMAVGVYRTAASDGNDSLSGEIWVNEMKLTGIRKITGTASRVDFSTKMADLISLQARMEYENGNFRRMTETANLPDNTQISGSMGASIGLEKFLPEEWGLSLPTGVTYNSSITRPQLKNETDVYLVDGEGKPDGFMDMIKDAVTGMVGIEQENNSVTRAELYQTGNVGRTYYTGYRKTTRDENPLVSFLFDRWNADARYSTTMTEVRYGKNVSGDTLFAKRDTTDIYSGKVHYDLSPRNPPEWLKWLPFKEVKQEWFPDRLKSYELTLLPRTIQFDVADVNFQRQRQVDTWRRLPHTEQDRFTVRHNLSIDHTPISPLLDLDYSLGINRDLIHAASDEAIEKGKKIFRRDETWNDYLLMWGEKDRTQHMGMNLSPRFFDWLTTSGSYSSDYSQTVVQWLKEPENYLNASVRTSLSLNGSVSFDQLFGGLKTATEKNSLGGLFETIKKGFDAIGLRQISANYTASSSLTNNYLSTGLFRKQHFGGMKDFMLYQAGLKGRSPLDLLTGEMDDDHFLGMQSRDTINDRYDFYHNDSRVVNRSLRLSSGFEIKPLDLSFRSISFNHGINYSVYPDTNRSDTTITFPDFSISMSSQILNKIELVKTWLQGLNLNSSFTYRQSDRLTSAQIGGSSRSIKFDLLPLASLSGTLKKWPIRFDYRHNYSHEKTMELDEFAKEGELNKNATMHQNEFTLNYDIERNSKLSEIKLLMWTIPVKGRTTIGLTLNQRSEKDEVPDSKSSTLEIIPKLSYVFTDNVNGRLEFTFRQNDIRGKTQTTWDFSIILRISF
ncbi:MAG: cell surface protein SprA [Chitinispirillaceae bacterium]|nr:cell surface protein SprA [Chitinispirillaceae bacterium]